MNKTYTEKELNDIVKDREFSIFQKGIAAGKEHSSPSPKTLKLVAELKSEIDDLKTTIDALKTTVDEVHDILVVAKGTGKLARWMVGTIITLASLYAVLKGITK